LVPPELEVNDQCKESIDKFVKDTLQQSNAMKITNFGKLEEPSDQNTAKQFSISIILPSQIQWIIESQCMSQQ